MHAYINIRSVTVLKADFRDTSSSRSFFSSTFEIIRMASVHHNIVPKLLLYQHKRSPANPENRQVCTSNIKSHMRITLAHCYIIGNQWCHLILI